MTFHGTCTLPKLGETVLELAGDVIMGIDRALAAPIANPARGEL